MSKGNPIQEYSLHHLSKTENPPYNKQESAKTYRHLIPNQKQLLDLPYYQGIMSETQANMLLAGRPRHSFIIRKTKHLGNWSLALSTRTDYRYYGYETEPGPNWDGSYSMSTVLHVPNFIDLCGAQGHIMDYNEIQYCHLKDCKCQDNEGERCDTCDCVWDRSRSMSIPFNRKMPFSLQELVEAVVNDHTTYNKIGGLPLPPTLKKQLRTHSLMTNTLKPPLTQSCTGTSFSPAYTWHLGSPNGGIHMALSPAPEPRHRSSSRAPRIEGPCNKDS